MKKAVAVIAVICIVIIAGVVLVLTGTIDLFGKQIDGNVAKETVVCMPFMNAFVGTDEDGVVKGTYEYQPDSTMLITGLSFTRIVEGETAGTEDQESLNYALKVYRELMNNGIDDVREIAVAEDGTVSFYTGQVCVLLGSDSQTGKKISDLSGFYNTVKDMNGTLDMQNVSVENRGYTFKKSQIPEENIE